VSIPKRLKPYCRGCWLSDQIDGESAGSFKYRTSSFTKKGIATFDYVQRMKRLEEEIMKLKLWHMPELQTFKHFNYETEIFEVNALCVGFGRHFVCLQAGC